MSDATMERDQLPAPDNAVDVWREFFHHWPSGVPRSGVLVTKYAEQIPFGGFLTTSDMVLLDRRHPDTTGARKVLIPFHSVDAVKFTDVLVDEIFQAAGFEGGTDSNSHAGHGDADPTQTSVGASEDQLDDEADDVDDLESGGQGLASARFLADQIKRQKEQQQQPARDTSPTAQKPDEEDVDKPRVKLPAWALRR